MRLFYTPRSHFSRKVRILLDAWSCRVELVDVGNVADADAAAFAGHPLMKVPTLVDDGVWVIDSDHIARYLTKAVDPQDRFDVLADDVSTLNQRAVMNGIMSAEVEVILAARTGIDVHAHGRFHKLLQSMTNGLEWLDRRVDALPTEPTYIGFHAVCLWDHLALYGLVPLPYDRLHSYVRRISKAPFVAQSAPR